MSHILDLTCFQEQTLDITMPDNTLLHIPKPSEAMVIAVLALRNINPASDAGTIVNATNKLTGAILNTNTAGITYEAKQVAEMPIAIKSAIIKAYGDFIANLQ